MLLLSALLTALTGAGTTAPAVVATAHHSRALAVHSDPQGALSSGGRRPSPIVTPIEDSPPLPVVFGIASRHGPLYAGRLRV